MNPNSRRRALGRHLRRFRDDAGVSMEEIADRLRCTSPKISRIETGQVKVRARDLKDMLDMYRVEDPKVRDEMAELARQGSQRGWWYPYSDAIPAQHSTFIGYETDATAISNYEPLVIPGLLQTEDYARAIVEIRGIERSVIDERVAVRMKRQEILYQPDAPAQLWTVIDEAALRRQVGSVETMRAQLAHLLEAAKQPSVNIQVLPFAAGAHAATCGPLEIFEFTDAEPVVFLENLVGDVLLDNARQVRACTLVFDQLRALALGPGRQSVDFIKQLSGELT